MNIKRKISLILIASILFSFGIYSFAYASTGEATLTYIPVDLTPFNNSLAYTDAENYNNLKVENDEDYFRIDVANGTGNLDHSYALDADTVEALYVNGLVYHNGIPFDWNTDGAVGISGNGKAGITASCHGFHSNHIQSATVDVPDGNYTKLNFLAFTTFSTKNGTTDRKSPFHIELIYEDGTKSTNMTLNSTADLQNDPTLDQIAIEFFSTWNTTTTKITKRTDLKKSVNYPWYIANVGVYSLDIDMTRTLKEVRFYNEGTAEVCWKAQMKVLALTLAQKSINDFIIETIPLSENITLENLNDTYEKIDVVEAMMQQQGIDENSLTAEAKERLNKAKEVCEARKSDYINSLVEALPIPEDVDSTIFIDVIDQISKVEAEMDKYGVSVENIREDLREKIPALKEECEIIKYDYIDSKVDELPLPEEVTLDIYNDVLEQISDVEAEMDKYGVLYEDISEASKTKISALKERCDNIYYYHIEGLVEKLPLVEEINPSKYYDVSEQIADVEAEMEKYSVSYDDISEASKTKISELKEKLAEVKPTYTMFDISEYRTSKLFVYDAQKTNIRLNKTHDFLSDGQPGTYYNNLALSGDDLITALGDDNIIEDKNHIPYLIDNDLTIPVCGNSYGISGIAKTEVDLPDGVYSSINFLAFSNAGTINYGSTTITLNYDDGTATVLKKYPIKSKTSNDSENEDWVFGAKYYAHYDTGYLETVSFPNAAGNYGIYTYEVIPEKGKIVDSIIFQNENTYLGWVEKFKVLAISAIDETSDKIANFAGKKLSELSSSLNVSAEELKAIKSNLDKLEGLGYDTQSLSNISEFNNLYENLIEVESYNISSEADKVTAEIVLTSEALSFEKDKIKLYSGSEEIDSKYVDISFKGENGNTKSITLTFPNFLDYDSEYKVVLSKDITSIHDSRLTLSEDREVKFNIKPTVYVSDAKTEINGSKISVSVNLSNETGTSRPYAVMFGLYSKDGELLNYVTEEGNLDTEKLIERKISIPNNVEDYSVEFYLLDSYSGRRLIWEPIVLIGG